MPFNSYEFIFIFLPVTLGGFWLLTRSMGRNGAIGWLILVSLGFHAYAGWKSLAIVVLSILLTYLFVQLLLRSGEERHRQRLLILIAGVTADIALLGYFKYKNFFLDTANVLFERNFELEALILPLGISFLTFQKIALLADVYAGTIRNVRFSDYAIFTLFFPRTVSGPIVRYEEIVPQFATINANVIAQNAPVAICLFAIGIFKKTVIADGLAPFASPAFVSADPVSFIVAWSSVLAYTFQLYFDFSGYTDMALGAARLFGIKLPMNFNSPFRSCSIVEFWNRWHITLTRFLTAYVYTPIVLHLTRARLEKGKQVLRGRRSTGPAVAILVGMPTLLTMAISGIWHGAGWQFVIWGLLHGIYLTINQSWRILRPRFWSDQTSYERIMKPLGWMLTFGAVVVALAFFRADSVPRALNIVTGMFGMNGFLPFDAQLLESMGFKPLEIVEFMRPFHTFYWIGALLLGTLVLPNSLEILRRFEPALDFSRESDGIATSLVLQASSGQSKPKQAKSLVGLLRSTWTEFRNVRHEGIYLTKSTAVIAALVWTIGVMAISASNAFIYGQF